MSNNFNFGHLSAVSMVAPEQISMTTPEIIRAAVAKLHLRSTWRESQWVGNTPFHCPFHKDKTPSMYLHMDKGMYHCFSCNRSGNVYSLYRDITGRDLNKDLNIPNDAFSNFSRAMNSDQFADEDYSTLGRDVAVEMEGPVFPIREVPEAVSYLRRRGITFDVAEAMQMIVMPAGRINGTFFKDRLLIPIYENSKLISVEGRDLTGEQRTKVLYAKDTSVNSLYEMDKLDPTLPIYVVEGLMDLAVLRTDPFFRNSTAIFGAGVTRRQLWLLDQYEELVLIPDNDKAGRGTLKKLHEELTRPFYVLRLPPNKDPLKDIGDIPTKLHTTVQALRKRGWGRTLVTSTSIHFPKTSTK